MSTRKKERLNVSPPERGPERGPEVPDGEARLLRYAAWAAIAVAIFVRVALLSDKPFWRDEAWVALLAGDPMQAVLDARAVPIGFLLLTHLTAWIPFLSPEVTYRLVPLLAGIAVVPLFAALATTLGASLRTGVIAMWLAVAMHPLVFYSRELKPYEIDVLLTLLLPLLAVRGFRQGSAAARYGLMATLVAAPWLSFAGLFPIGAVLAGGSLAWWRNMAGDVRRDWLISCGLFLWSFAFVYVLVLGSQSTSDVQFNFWKQYMIASSDDPVSRAIEAVQRYFSLATAYPFGELRWPALLLAAVGGFAWPRPHRAYLAWLVVAMTALCLAASAIDRYIVAQGRHLMFAIPVLVLWTANGLHEAARRLGPRAGMVAALALPIAVSLWWTWAQIDSRVGPYESVRDDFFRFDIRHDVEGALAKVDPEIPAGAPVLITNWNAYAFQFYARGRLPQAEYCPRYCFDFAARAERWMRSLDRRGYMLATDEERDRLGKLAKKTGFTWRTARVADGIDLWTIERAAAPGKAAPPRPRS
jgi:hypothetical protein